MGTIKLFNTRTGQYITPEAQTFKAWQEGRRPWLIHMKADKEKDLQHFRMRLIQAKEFTPHKVEYYQQIIKNIMQSPNL